MKPEIRFNGFSDEWVEKKLGNVTNRFDSDRKAVAASNRTKGNIPYYGAVGIQGYVNGFTHDGEYLLIAEDGASSMLGYPVRVTSGKIWVNNHAHVLAALNTVADNKYLRYKLLTIDMTPYITGGSRHKLTASDLATINIQLPTLPEQQKIGGLFSKYDAIIALREQKLEELDALKKGLLQQMFPKNGEKVPELRFAGFADEWVEHKLGESEIRVATGKLNANAATTNGKYPFFTTALETYMTDSYSFDDDAILIAGNGNLGFVKEYNGKFDAYQREYVLTNFEGYAKSYLVSYFKHLLGEHISHSSKGSAMPYITKDVLESFLIVAPTFPEQQKIGQLFKHLDARISNEQAKIEQLKDQKQGLLQRMLTI